MWKGVLHPQILECCEVQKWDVWLLAVLITCAWGTFVHGLMKKKPGQTGSWKSLDLIIYLLNHAFISYYKTYGELGSEPKLAGGLHLGEWGRGTVWRNGTKFSSWACCLEKMSNVESYCWWVIAVFPAPVPLEASELSASSQLVLGCDSGVTLLGSFLLIFNTLFFQ